MTHTPGPWFVVEENGLHCPSSTCPNPAGAGIRARGTGRIIAATPEDTDALPNARLIDAAPELLAALKQMTLAVNVHGVSVLGLATIVVTNENLNEARALIARAKGETK